MISETPPKELEPDAEDDPENAVVVLDDSESGSSSVRDVPESSLDIDKHIAAVNRRKRSRLFIADESSDSEGPAKVLRVSEEDVYRSLRSAIDLEISNYLRMPKVEDREILEFWHEMRTELPNLASVARIVLGIPATSAASERTFSLARSIIRDNRARLSHQVVKQSVFLCANEDLFHTFPPVKPEDAGTKE